MIGRDLQKILSLASNIKNQNILGSFELTQSYPVGGNVNKRHFLLRTLKTMSVPLALSISISACVSLSAFGGTSWKGVNGVRLGILHKHVD